MPDDMRRQTLPMQTRAAAVETVNVEARTVELVWSTGAPVVRRDWWTGERYEEQLSLEAAHVDLGRLNNGAPLLNTHGQYDLRDIIGVVESATVDGTRGTALVRFSEREDVEPIWRDVQSGIIRNVSVGYLVRKYEVTKEDGKMPIYRAVDWEPMELSLVPVPADAGAGTRAATAESTCILVNRAQPTSMESTMPDTSAQTAGSEPVENFTRVADPAPVTEAPKPVAVAEFRKVAQALGFTADVALDAIERGLTLEQFRAEAINKKAEESETVTTRSEIRIVRDEVDTRRAAAENALLHRHNPATALTDAAREYRGLSLLELGRDLLEARGVRTRGLGKTELAGLMLGLEQRGMHGTSDFPFILANVANKTLRAAYEAAPRTFLPFCRRASAADFKDMSRVQLGDAPSLEKVNASGEFKRGSVGEAREQYRVETFGKVVAVNRQTIINDDLGAFTRLPEMFGRAAADLESDTVWSIIISNPTMGDGVTLFHATHGNSGAGAVGLTGISAMRTAMRKQKGLNGRFINVLPAFILAPAALETAVLQFINTTLMPATTATVVPEAIRNLTPIIEPRLDADSAAKWYGAADPAQIDTIEYAYLDGNDGVYLETRTGFDVDGVELKARLDFGAKALDHRGLYYSTGV